VNASGDLVVAAVRQHADPGFPLLCRRTAERLADGDAATDPVQALATLVTRFDNRADLIELACAKAERQIAGFPV
jgi:hypothetical protein